VLIVVEFSGSPAAELSHPQRIPHHLLDKDATTTPPN